MNKKKIFKVYYLLLSEGTTEFNLFGYLTTKKFKESFEKSNIQFSIKVEIVEYGISQGKLNSGGNLSSFKGKYNPIKYDDRYKGQKLFFIMDKDFDDSSQIETLIKNGGDIVQFVEYNSEYLLLKLSGKNPKKPVDFNNLGKFRDYCKSGFKKHFGKKAPDFKDADFDSIFSSVTDKEIKDSFTELFSTLS
jgi:hypothetical protein